VPAIDAASAAVAHDNALPVSSRSSSTATNLSSVAVAVSGLSDDEDEALAALGVAHLEGRTPVSISA